MRSAAEELGTTVLVEAKGVSFESSLYVLILANAVGFVGYLSHGWVGDRIGRRNTVLMGFLLGGVGYITCGLLHAVYGIRHGLACVLHLVFRALLATGHQAYARHQHHCGSYFLHCFSP